MPYDSLQLWLSFDIDMVLLYVKNGVLNQQ